MIESSDPYVYPGTDVLRNRRDLRDSGQLQKFEARVTSRRLVEWRARPRPATFDAAHLRAIHRYLFQDVYAWAGEFRTVFISKGTHTFEAPYLLARKAEDLAREIKRANRFRGLTRREFAAAAAALFARLNQLHPFREGNGRTQREFIRELALQAGHTLSFDIISKERMIAASIAASGGGKLEMMERLFVEISDVTLVEVLRETIEFLSGPHFNNFNWNDRYLAITTPGREYRGSLVGRQGTQCLIVDAEGRLFVSSTKSLPASARSGDIVTFVAQEF